MKRRTLVTSTPSAAINVTSLLDITFVLLISFMVVAPALHHGLDLELPRVSDAPALEDKQKAISIAVKGSTIVVDGDRVPMEGLLAAVRDAANGDLERPVALEGDRGTDWETMAQVIGALRAGGVKKIGIVTVLGEV